MTRTLSVDGIKEVIANGRSSSMHAISNSTDYTHTRIVGYAHSLEDANLFAAAPELLGAMKNLIDVWITAESLEAMRHAIAYGTSAVDKAETRT